MKSFERSFASDVNFVKPVIVEVLTYMRRHIQDISGEKEYDLRLALAEILYNAIIHGNNGDSNKKVFLKLQIVKRTVIIKVVDEGDGFDYKTLLAGFGKDDSLENEHGRGVRLAISLMDEFSFNEKGNEVVCSKRVAAYE